MQPRKRRFVVNDLGWGYAVHDTQARVEFGFVNPDLPKSSNQLNSARVDIYPTAEQALDVAEELNRKHEARKGKKRSA